MFFRLPIVKFFSRLLNRATITVALVLLQAGWLLWAFSYLTTGRIWVNAALRLLSLFIVLYLVRKDEDSSYKIIWIVLIGLLTFSSMTASTRFTPAFSQSTRVL